MTDFLIFPMFLAFMGFALMTLVLIFTVGIPYLRASKKFKTQMRAYRYEILKGNYTTANQSMWGREEIQIAIDGSILSITKNGWGTYVRSITLPSGTSVSRWNLKPYEIAVLDLYLSRSILTKVVKKVGMTKMMSKEEIERYNFLNAL